MDNFLLSNKFSEILYHEFASTNPILDYHCHLNIAQISMNTKFNNLYVIWIKNDHYKWRVMRFNGVHEDYCTGNKSSYEKFVSWIETLNLSIGNPIYNWSILEFESTFGI